MPESFENGTDGWGFLNGGGTVGQTTSFATDGTFGLEVDTTTADWVGVTFPSAIDLSASNEFVFDLQTLGAGTSPNMAIQTGSAWTWCQTSNAAYVNANRTTSVTTRVSSFSCTPDLTQVHRILIWSNVGTFNIDNVRAASSAAPILLHSFESGTEGWGPQTVGHGTVQQETAFATNGSSGLEIDDTTADWYGRQYGGAPLDLTGKTSITFDVQTLATGTTPMIVVQSGSGWSWCQSSPGSYIPANTSTSVSFDFTTLGCAPTLSQVDAFYIWFDTGTFYVDNIQAQ